MNPEAGLSQPESQENKKSFVRRCGPLAAAGLAAMFVGKNVMEQPSIDIEESTEEPVMTSDMVPESLYADMESGREAMMDELRNANSFFDLKNVLTGSGVEFGGKIWVIDDAGEVHSADDISAAIDGVYEDVLDQVAEITSTDNLGDIQIEKPETLNDMPHISQALHEKMGMLAEFSFQFDQATTFERGGDHFQSVENFTVSGLDYSLHSIVPDGSDAENVQLVMPGYATTAESYKRLAIEMAFQGKPVSVVNIHELNPVIEGDATFDELPTLPQAYAEIANDALTQISERGEVELDGVAYSTGSIGLTYATEANPNIQVENLTLISPVGLHKDNYVPSLVDAGVMGYEVLSTHSQQVAEASSVTERASQIHGDVSEGPKKMKQDVYEGSVVSENKAELLAGQDVIQVELENPIRNIVQGGETNIQIISFNGDVFAKPNHITYEMSGVDVGHTTLEGFHSTIKYDPEIIAHQIGATQKEG